MGFTYEQDTTVTLEIDGKVYTAPVDSPDFIAYWRKWQDRANELSKYSEYTEAQLQAIPDEEADRIAKEGVLMCAEMVVALFGIGPAQEIFNGRERSILFCMSLSDYIYEQIKEQGLEGRIISATRKYSPDEVQGD